MQPQRNRPPEPLHSPSMQTLPPEVGPSQNTTVLIIFANWSCPFPEYTILTQTQIEFSPSALKRGPHMHVFCMVWTVFGHVVGICMECPLPPFLKNMLAMGRLKIPIFRTSVWPYPAHPLFASPSQQNKLRIVAGYLVKIPPFS